MELSSEQQALLQAWQQGHSIKLVAVHGAGKTLCLEKALTISYFKNDAKIVFVSYNRDLINDAMQRCNKLFGNNWQKRIFIGTYHSLLGSLTGEIVPDELIFSEVLSKLGTYSCFMNWFYRGFQVLLLDEAQDLRPSYFQTILEIIYRLSANPLQHLHTGDGKQILYTYYPVNRADVRFLTHIDQLSIGNWQSHRLTISYRSTPAMAHFLNFLFPDRQIIPRPGNYSYKPVILFITDIYNTAPDHLLPVIQQYRNKKVFILSSSTNEKSPCIPMVDKLVQARIPVHVNRSGNLNDNNHNNTSIGSDFNVFVNTYHGSKGLECDLNIVYMRDSLFDVLTPAHYVAFGRGKEELIIVMDPRNVSVGQLGRFNQLTQRDLRVICDRPLMDTPIIKKELGEQDQFSTHSLFSFIDVVHLQKLVSSICITPKPNFNVEVNPYLDTASIDHYFQQFNVSFDQGKTFINVSQIVGAAITYALEFTITKKIPYCIGAMLTECNHKHDEKHKFLARQMEDIIHQLKQQGDIQFIPNVVCQKFQLFAKMATVMDAFAGYTEKVAFISHFHWIETVDIFQRYKQLFYNVLYILSEHNLKPQQIVWYKTDVGPYLYGDKHIRITSKPTMVCEKALVVEIIHKPKIHYEDHLRALTSAQIAGDEKTAVYVINIATGTMEQSQLHYREHASLYFIRSALNGKLFEEKQMEDETFLKQYRDYIDMIKQT
jgi:hypothetical protein